MKKPARSQAALSIVPGFAADISSEQAPQQSLFRFVRTKKSAEVKISLLEIELKKMREEDELRIELKQDIGAAVQELRLRRMTEIKEEIDTLKLAFDLLPSRLH